MRGIPREGFMNNKCNRISDYFFSETFSCPIIIMFAVNVDIIFFSAMKTFLFVGHET